MDRKNCTASVRACLAAMALLAPASLRASEPAPSPKLDLSRFKLVWHDEFEGDRLDSSRWQAPEMVRQGHSRWVPSLVSVRDGVLRLGIRRTPDSVIRYECGAVQTRRDFDPAQTLFQQMGEGDAGRRRIPRRLRPRLPWHAAVGFRVRIGAPA